MTAKELQKILDKHKKWWSNIKDGERANLRRADLQGAYLRRADLQGADLQGANLRRADLQGAYLQGADLQGAYLQGADLQGAYLQGAKIDFRQHDIMAEILKRAAKDDVKKLKIAGLILIKREWCWTEFLAIRDSLKKWALMELRKWIKDGYNVPDILKK